MAASRYSRYYTYIKPVVENKLVRSFAPYIFSVLTITVLIVFAIRPTVTTILTLQTNIDNDRQVLDALKNKVISLNLARDNWLKIDSTQRQKLEIAIPSTPSVPVLVGALRGLVPADATLSAIQIQPLNLYSSIAEVDQTNAFKLSDVEFSFNIQGTFDQLKAVLANLKKSTRSLSIRSIILNKATEGSDLTLSVTGKAHYLK